MNSQTAPNDTDALKLRSIALRYNSTLHTLRAEGRTALISMGVQAAIADETFRVLCSVISDDGPVKDVQKAAAPNGSARTPTTTRKNGKGLTREGDPRKRRPSKMKDLLAFFAAKGQAEFTTQDVAVALHLNVKDTQKMLSHQKGNGVLTHPDTYRWRVKANGSKRA